MSKTKAQIDQNTPHMKNIHKHEEHTPRKLIQIKSSNTIQLAHQTKILDPKQ